jgi:hypothetical protein
MSCIFIGVQSLCLYCCEDLFFVASNALCFASSYATELPRDYFLSARSVFVERNPLVQVLP